MRLVGMLELAGGVENFTFPEGAAFPEASQNELFHLTQAFDTYAPGLYMYKGTSWVLINDLTPSQQSASYSGTFAVVSGTSRIPTDAIPLITDGTQLWSADVTPTKLGTKFAISTSFFVDCGSNSRIITAALFRNNTFVRAWPMYMPTSRQPTTLTIHHLDSVGNATLVPVVYSMQIGVNSAATWYVNRGATTATYGQDQTSSYLIQEV